MLYSPLSIPQQQGVFTSTHQRYSKQVCTTTLIPTPLPLSQTTPLPLLMGTGRWMLHKLRHAKLAESCQLQSGQISKQLLCKHEFTVAQKPIITKPAGLRNSEFVSLNFQSTHTNIYRGWSGTGVSAIMPQFQLSNESYYLQRDRTSAVLDPHWLPITRVWTDYNWEPMSLREDNIRM